MIKETISALIESIRGEIRGLEFEPLDDQALAEISVRTECAHNDAESEGVMRSPRTAALFKMLEQERAPDAIRDLAVQRFLDGVAAIAQAAEKHRSRNAP